MTDTKTTSPVEPCGPHGAQGPIGDATYYTATGGSAYATVGLMLVGLVTLVNPVADWIFQQIIS